MYLHASVQWSLAAPDQHHDRWSSNVGCSDWFVIEHVIRNWSKWQIEHRRRLERENEERTSSAGVNLIWTLTLCPGRRMPDGGRTSKMRVDGFLRLALVSPRRRKRPICFPFDSSYKSNPCIEWRLCFVSNAPQDMQRSIRSEFLADFLIELVEGVEGFV